MATRVNALAVMAKAPEAGRVKTRMLPALSAEQAAELCRALLLDQLEHLQDFASADLYVAFTPAEAAPLMQSLASPGFRLFPQEGTDLGERMERAFEKLWKFSHKNIVLIGSDLPAPPLRFFEDAFAFLLAGDRRAVLGPSRDGGYYLVGLNQPVPEIFEAMAWSHERVLAETRARLAALKLDTLLLPAWFDVDTPDDLGYLKSQFDFDSSLAERMKHTFDLLKPLELSRQTKARGMTR